MLCEGVRLLLQDICEQEPSRQVRENVVEFKEGKLMTLSQFSIRHLGEMVDIQKVLWSHEIQLDTINFYLFFYLHGKTLLQRTCTAHN